MNRLRVMPERRLRAALRDGGQHLLGVLDLEVDERDVADERLHEREALDVAAEGGSCSEDDGSKRRMRQAVIGDPEQMQVPRPEPAPVVIRFEAIISIDLAGLNW